MDEIEISFVLPCRDEEQTVALCVKRIKAAIAKAGISAEIIVVDNASKDRSAEVAHEAGARVIKEEKLGYGSALLRGFSEAKGKYLVMADADNTYDFFEFPKLIEKLKFGSDLVLGSRMKGRIKPGSMPFIRRYIGNPILAGILNLFFNSKISDPQTGFRALKRQSLQKMALKTTGMEFASEMIISSIKKNLKISEVPITYYARITESKLRPVSDGWRHLRFMLMYSPTYLFMIPGILTFVAGLLLLFSYFINPISAARAVSGSLISILGYQIINIGLYAKTYAIISGFEQRDPSIDFIAKHFPLEKTILIGSIIFVGALATGLYAVKLDKNSIPVAALTFLILGIQTIFSAFFLSIMLVEKKN